MGFPAVEEHFHKAFGRYISGISRERGVNVVFPAVVETHKHFTADSIHPKAAFAAVQMHLNGTRIARRNVAAAAEGRDGSVRQAQGNSVHHIHLRIEAIHEGGNHICPKTRR